jgi:hypothetical protein
MNSKLQERMITQEVSPEFIRANTPCDADEAQARVERAAVRLERNYSVVAWVETNEEYYASETGYTIRTIITHDADIDEVKHGVQSCLYWLSEGASGE